MTSEPISQQVLAHLVDEVADGIVVVDAKGTHLFVNRAFRRMTGFDGADLLGQGPPHPYWPPEHLEEILSAFGDTTSGQPASYHLTFRTKDETRFPVEVTPTFVPSDDGAPLIIATVRDRSESIRHRGQIEQSRRLIDTMIRAGALGWWTWELDGDIGDVSDSYFTVLGHPPGAWDASFEAWAALVHPEDIGEADRSMRDLVEGRSNMYESEHRFRAADGSWRWILARGFVVETRPDGSPAVIAGTCQNVDRVKRQEEKLNQFYRMEVVGQMAGGIAHDFNNLLMALSGNLEFLRDEADGSMLPHVEQMQHVLDRASDLTGSLLRYSSDGDDGEVERVDLVEALRAIEPVATRLLPPTVTLDIELEEQAAPSRLVRVQFDSIVLNLVINARDAIESGSGRIRIRAGRRHVGIPEVSTLELDPGTYLEVTVEDDGVGMSPDVVERAFEPLFTTKPQGRGTGLGLPMVRKFVDGHGGSVRITSRVGEGTTVSLYLPVLDPDGYAGLDMDGDVTAIEQGSGSVLVVDDDPMLLGLLSTHLARTGYQVRSAANPRHALSLLAEDAADVLVTDIVMPFTLDGVELARRARAMYPELPVVFITGYADRDQREEARRMGAIVDKPFRLDELRARISEAITPRAP